MMIKTGNRYLIIIMYMIFIKSIMASSLMDEGNRFFIKKQYETAITLYEQVLLKSGNQADYPEAIFQIAECHKLLGHYEIAQKTYWKLVVQYPNSDLADNAYLSMADWSARRGKEHLTEAVVMYETIISRYHESDSVPYAWLGLAKTRYRLNFYEGAEDALNQLIKKYPDHVILSEAYYELGTILADPHNPRRDVTLAIYNLKKLIERYPFSQHLANAYFDLGTLFWEKGKYQDAIQSFKQLTDKYSRSFLAPLAQTNIALCYTDAQDYKHAIQAYNILLNNYVHPPSVKNNIQMLIDHLIDREKDKLKISAWKVEQNRKQKCVFYEGDVKIMLNQMEIWAHKAVVFPNQKTFEADGCVRLIWKDSICLSGKHLACNLKSKTCIVSGEATMNQRLKNDLVMESWDVIEFSLSDGSYLGKSVEEKVK